MRIEAHAEIAGSSRRDNARYDPQGVFDASRERLIAFQCRMAGPQVSLLNVQLGENGDDARMPINDDWLAIGPMRQCGVAHAR